MGSSSNEEKKLWEFASPLVDSNAGRIPPNGRSSTNMTQQYEQQQQQQMKQQRLEQKRISETRIPYVPRGPPPPKPPRIITTLKKAAAAQAALEAELRAKTQR